MGAKVTLAVRVKVRPVVSTFPGLPPNRVVITQLDAPSSEGEWPQ